MTISLRSLRLICLLFLKIYKTAEGIFIYHAAFQVFYNQGNAYPAYPADPVILYL